MLLTDACMRAQANFAPHRPSQTDSHVFIHSFHLQIDGVMCTFTLYEHQMQIWKAKRKGRSKREEEDRKRTEKFGDQRREERTGNTETKKTKQNGERGEREVREKKKNGQYRKKKHKERERERGRERQRERQREREKI